MTTNPRLKPYRVRYVVQRIEYYEIDARNADEAEDLAFQEGEQVDPVGNPCDIGECFEAIATASERVKNGGAR